MATLSVEFPTLVDLGRLPDNRMQGQIIDLLAQKNPILQDAPAIECNMGHAHKTTVRTGLPTTTWGKLYKGIPATKGIMQSVQDVTGFLESAAQVDQRLVDIHEKAEDKASVRLNEASGHLEAQSQEAATAIFYHDSSVDPEKPMGFAPRFNSTAAENGGQIVLGGGAGADNTSVWMITWDPQTSHLLYPKGSRGGIRRTDRGVIQVADASGDLYWAYREEFSWDLGLTVRDWRYVTRLANIDISDLSVDATTGVDLMRKMTDMYYKHEGRRDKRGQTFFYANSTIVEFLDHQAREVPSNLQLKLGETGPNAQEVLTFRGLPVRETDALVNTESLVS